MKIKWNKNVSYKIQIIIFFLENEIVQEKEMDKKAKNGKLITYLIKKTFYRKRKYEYCRGGRYAGSILRNRDLIKK